MVKRVKKRRAKRGFAWVPGASNAVPPAERTARWRADNVRPDDVYRAMAAVFHEIARATAASPNGAEVVEFHVIREMVIQRLLDITARESRARAFPMTKDIASSVTDEYLARETLVPLGRRTSPGRHFGGNLVE